MQTVSMFSVDDIQFQWRKFVLYQNGLRNVELQTQNHCHFGINSAANNAPNKKFNLVKYLRGTLKNFNIYIEIKTYQLDAANGHPDYQSQPKKHPYLFTFGSYFEGFRYLVFIDGKHTHNQFNSVGDIQALVQPLSIWTWMLLVTTYFVVAWLGYLARLENPLMYLLSLLIEQENLVFEGKTASKIAVISVWLYATFWFRLAYTSSLFSNLAAVPDPTYPRNLNESLSDDGFYKFASSHDVPRLLYRINYDYNRTLERFTVVKSSYSLLTRLAEAIYSLTILEDPPETEYEKMKTIPPYQIQALHNYSNRVYVEKYTKDCKKMELELFKS